MSNMEITRYAANLPEFKNKKLEKYAGIILKAYNNTQNAMYEIVKALHQVDISECWKDDGFLNAADFAMKIFGFQKAYAYALLKIGNKYCTGILDENGKNSYGSILRIHTGDGTDYTVTQLFQFQTVPPEILIEWQIAGIIKPSMSCRDLAKIVKSWKTLGKPQTADDFIEKLNAANSAEPDKKPDSDSEGDSDGDGDSDAEMTTPYERAYASIYAALTTAIGAYAELSEGVEELEILKKCLAELENAHENK